MTERETVSDTVPATLPDAIAAARSGRRDEAARLLRQIVADDPFNADAWIWLGGVAAEPHEQRSALEHALTIAPNDQRAQQGLAWLRQTHPEVFAEATNTTATGTSPSFVTDAPPEVEGRANVYDAPTQAQPVVHSTIYDAQTQAAPAAQPAALGSAPDASRFQTDRMPVQRPATTRTADVRTTDQMTAVSRPQAYPDDAVVERRSPFANFARWVIMALYLFSFGAATTLAGLSLYYGAQAFAQVVNGQLIAFGAQLAPSALTLTYWSAVGVLAAIAVLDLIIALGFAFRQRWSWWLNLLIATLTLAGAVALLVPDFTFPASQIGSFTLNNVVVQSLAGLTLFTALFWILSMASRRAFYRRRVVQNHGR